MINDFRGENRWLSNFWPCEITDNRGCKWASAEHAYQAMKYTSREMKEKIAAAATSIGC